MYGIQFPLLLSAFDAILMKLEIINSNNKLLETEKWKQMILKLSYIEKRWEYNLMKTVSKQSLPSISAELAFKHMPNKKGSLNPYSEFMQVFELPTITNSFVARWKAYFELNNAK